MGTEYTESRRRISAIIHFSGSVILEPHDKELLAARNEHLSLDSCLLAPVT